MRAVVVEIAGVERRRGFKQNDLDFIFGHRLVLDAFGYDKDFAGPQFNHPVAAIGRIAKMQLQPAADDPEQFIFLLMEMPIKLALQLGNLDLLAVQLGNNFGGPAVGERGKFFSNIDFFQMHLVFAFFFAMARVIGPVAEQRARHVDCRPKASFQQSA